MKFVPKNPKARSVAKCHFCGRTPTVEETKTHYFWGTCATCRWRSRLFDTAEEVDLWLRTDFVPRKHTSIKVLKNVGLGGESYLVVGSGWQSRTFQTPEHALYWQHHHWGKPLKSAVAPTRIRVTDNPTSPEDDPVADLAEVQKDIFEMTTELQKDENFEAGVF
jgi:hypothetical protein